MSDQILVDERTGENTREASLAALIVGCLIHEDYIRLPKTDYEQRDLMLNAIKLIATLLRDRLNDEVSFPVKY